MKRLFSVILAVLLIISVSFVRVQAENVSVSARAYVLYCANNGEILLSRNADERLPMASTTKIMTALLTLEAAQKENKTVRFTDEMTAEGSSLYLQVGEKLTLRDLAVGMLMQSGNDAANAAAIALAGSSGAFADMMNDKAQELGMNDTRFVTPSGLDADGHYSTARDMALLMAAAMNNEDFRDITGKTEYTVSFIEPEGKSVTYPNHNKLLKLYDSCTGGKTGYTDLAGRCLVTCAERDGLQLIAVTLNDGDDWNDHIQLYDYGFDNYMLYTADARSYTVPVVGGAADSALICADPAVEMAIPADEADRVTQTVIVPPFVYAPLRLGQRVGKIRYHLDGKIIAEADLLSAQDIEYNSRRRSLWEYIKDLLNWHS